MDSEFNQNPSTPNQKTYSFPKDFFLEAGFIARFNQRTKELRFFIRKEQDRDELRDIMNAFHKACLTEMKDEKIHLHIVKESYRTLAYYGHVFESDRTFENIIENIEKNKERLFKQDTLGMNLIYADVLLKYYGIKISRSNGWYNEAGFRLLSKAKWLILKSYVQYKEGKNPISEEDFQYLLVLLSGCLLFSSRWHETIQYLNELSARDPNDPNLYYILALNLNEMKEKTCLDYNGQLLLKIIECCQKTLDHPTAGKEQKDAVSEIKRHCMDDLHRAKLKIETLRRHRQKIDSKKRQRNQYFMYCFDNNLFLNEHAFFCNCGRSVGDSLKIETAHPHTQIKWVQPFEVFLGNLITEYSMARKHLYQFETIQTPALFYKRERKDSNHLQASRDSCLKTAFKACYSLLDQISFGVFAALEIDIEAHLKQSIVNEGEPAQKVYFLNMWEVYKFTEEDFHRNLYLVSLQSITKDLDRNEYAALQSFKKYRNAMEHKMVFIKDKNSDASVSIKGSIAISRAELLEKTKVLMTLTRSAIITFAYLVRRQSKVKEMLAKDPHAFDKLRPSSN